MSLWWDVECVAAVQGVSQILFADYTDGRDFDIFMLDLRLKSVICGAYMTEFSTTRTAEVGEGNVLNRYACLV